MTTIPSKRSEPQSLPNPILVLTSTLVIGALLFWGVYTSTFQTSAGGGFQTPGIVGISTDSETSYAADLQYWDANCSHGQVSDPACNMIIAKAQSCEISSTSSYCSAYKAYMLQFLNR